MIGQKSYTAKKQNAEKKWHVIDASGKVMGRVAVEAANILRGKNKPEFTPNVNCGDYVVIINCAKMVLTGDKLEKKEYIRHTGWIGHLKRVQYKTLMATRPEFAMKMAVEGMLPHTTLGREQLTMLRVYAGEEHEHEAQVNAGTSTKKKVKKEKVKKGGMKAADRRQLTDDRGKKAKDKVGEVQKVSEVIDEAVKTPTEETAEAVEGVTPAEEVETAPEETAQVVEEATATLEVKPEESTDMVSEIPGQARNDEDKEAGE